MQAGRVAQLFRYPVKSMQGEQLGEAAVDARGLRGDRGWAVYTPDGGIGSGKTTRRFRRVEGLLDHRAALDGGSVPEVTLASGSRFRADAPGAGRTLSEALGRPVTLRAEGQVPHHDESPVHVVTTAALRHLGRLLGHPVDVHRVRPNVVLELDGDGFVEDGWTGRDLRIGEVVLRLGERMPRCVMVDLPQPGVVTQPHLLKLLGQVNDLCFGLQASVRTGGAVRVGDVARLA